MKIKSILVSQPKPETDKSPYLELAKKYALKMDFRPFIHVEGVPSQEFRKERINILDHPGIIFTSRNAVDHFFRICTEMRLSVPESMKYFCLSESTAYYLQKYVVYRKRKIFHGKQTIDDLISLLKKYKDERYLLPCSDILKDDIPRTLSSNKVRYTKAVMYRTICSDLSDLANVNYDMLVFFSPSGIKSLFKNFPDFKQNKTKIAAFGLTTARAVEEHGLQMDVHAPTPSAPSMTMAIENFIRKEDTNGKEKKSLLKKLVLKKSFLKKSLLKIKIKNKNKIKRKEDTNGKEKKSLFKKRVFKKLIFKKRVLKKTVLKKSFLKKSLLKIKNKIKKRK